MPERSRPFLTAQWRNLIIFTYAVDPTRLIDRVPAGTTLDSWRGKTLISLIGFQFLNTKVLGAPIPFHQGFEEVNLRFYVRRVVNDEIRPGVVFLRELVPHPMVGGVARLLYREPYLVVPMRSAVDAGRTSPLVRRVDEPDAGRPRDAGDCRDLVHVGAGRARQPRGREPVERRRQPAQRTRHDGKAFLAKGQKTIATSPRVLDRTATPDVENRNVRVVADRARNARLVAVLTGI